MSYFAACPDNVVLINCELPCKEEVSSCAEFVEKKLNEKYEGSVVKSTNEDCECPGDTYKEVINNELIYCVKNQTCACKYEGKVMEVGKRVKGLRFQ